MCTLNTLNMKTFALASTLVLLSISIYGQNTFHLKPHPDALELKLTPPEKNLSIIDYKHLRSLKSLQKSDQYFKRSKPEIGTEDLARMETPLKPQQKMPCYVPEVNDAMPIVEPDSRIDFSLLIRKTD